MSLYNVLTSRIFIEQVLKLKVKVMQV